MEDGGCRTFPLNFQCPLPSLIQCTLSLHIMDQGYEKKAILDGNPLHAVAVYYCIPIESDNLYVSSNKMGHVSIHLCYNIGFTR